MGSYPSSGLKKGVVVNIDATTDAIQKSLDQARASFEGKIKSINIKVGDKVSEGDVILILENNNEIKEKNKERNKNVTTIL
jgi:cell division ATPase FtsA